METTTLDKLPLGQEAIIAKVGGEGSILRSNSHCRRARCFAPPSA